jgi:serpin B
MSVALAMIHGGAKNNTEAEIAQVLHYELGQADLHPFFNKLDQDLNSRGVGATGADGAPFRLNVVNAVWGQKDYDFLESFLDLLALNYGAGLRILDFMSDPEAARKTINTWVEDQTESRIKDLLPQGIIDSSTRMVLTNAIYFNASWLTAFEKSATKTETFNLASGTSVQTSMMNGMIDARSAVETGYQAVELPYSGEELSMLMVIPDAGEFDAFEAKLDQPTLQGIIDKLSGSAVTLKMPSFEMETELGLKALLEELGLKEPFEGGIADFSGVDGTKNLFISAVLHKAFVKVDEAGTEAAAATAVVVSETSAPMPVSINADRPFIFFIRDHATNTIVFAGRVMDPTS